MGVIYFSICKSFLKTFYSVANGRYNVIERNHADVFVPIRQILCGLVTYLIVIRTYAWQVKSRKYAVYEYGWEFIESEREDSVVVVVLISGHYKYTFTTKSLGKVYCGFFTRSFSVCAKGK